MDPNMELLTAFILGAWIMYFLLKSNLRHSSSSTASPNNEADCPSGRKNTCTSTQDEENLSSESYTACLQKQIEKLSQDVSEMKLQAAHNDWRFMHSCQQHPLYQARTSHIQHPTCGYDMPQMRFNQSRNMQAVPTSLISDNCNCCCHDNAAAAVPKEDRNKSPNNSRRQITTRDASCSTDLMMEITHQVTNPSNISTQGANGHHKSDDNQTNKPVADIADCSERCQIPDGYYCTQRSVSDSHGTPDAGLNNGADNSNMKGSGDISSDIAPEESQQTGFPPLLESTRVVTDPLATHFPLSMPQPTITESQAVSQPAVLASGSPALVPLASQSPQTQPTTLSKPIVTVTTTQTQTGIEPAVIPDPPISKPAGNIDTVTPVVSSAAQTVTPATNMIRSMVSQVAKSSQPAAGVANTAPSSSSAPNTVGGSVFSGKPPPVSEDKIFTPVSQPQVSKANPFSNFTFGLPAPVPLTSKSATTKSTSHIKPLVTHVRTPGKSPIKPGRVMSPGAEGPGGEGHDDHFEPNVDFKPVVQLPEKVDLITGEENEEKLFCERAKLYRQDEGQWKERGKGELKILSDKTTGKSRIVMRRDQVLKLCANHVITADMELKPLTNTENAVCWFAQDYSEEEVKNESLAAKFLSADDVARFKEIFESCRKKISMPDSAKESTGAPVQKEPQSLAELLRRDDQLECSVGMVSNDKSMDKPAVKPPEPAAAPFSFGAPKDSQKQSLADMFKAKSGQWDCDTCMVRNEDSTTVCPACQTVRPGFTKPESKPAASSFSMGGFTFGKVSGPVTFGAVAAPPQANPSDTGKAADSKPAFTFGAPNKAGEEKQGIQFGGSSGFRFGSSPSVSKPQASAPVDLSVKTIPVVNVTRTTVTTKPALGTGTFTFTPAKSTSVPTETSPQLLGGYYINKECDDDKITFEPIIQLPEKVELKTGEENEEILFMERAKLLRFVGEWKERGVGEVKLLQHRTSNRVRVVMRREKVYKLCLNHVVNESIDFQAMPNGKGKAWAWHADDFSDGEEPVHEIFAIRFITKEVAKRFKSVSDKSRETKPRAQEKRGNKLVPIADENGSDVELADDINIDAAKVEKARVFKLPDTFYNYENQPTCSGCIGCVEPPFDFAKIGQARVYANISSRQPDDIKTVPLSPKVFGGSSGLVDFASLASNTVKDKGFAKKAGEGSFKWAGLGSGVFGLPARNKDNTDHQDDDDSHFEPDVDFAPVVTLPEITNFKTGEEEEEVIFKNRAILFRFDLGMWKEKGRGEIKLLKHTTTGSRSTHYQNDVDFAPVVTLPEVTDLKTGEEEEEVIFKNRAILYRFDLGMWKEKGRGEIKLLKHTSTGQSRLLMRREQVLKVACNHRLTPDMSLEKLATSETAWCWFAVDYAEDEAKNEQFAVKFKNKAIAEEFKTHFDACKVDQESSPKKDTAGSGDGKPVTTKQSTDTDGKPAKTSDVSSTTSTADKPSGFTPAGPELFSTPATSAGPALFTAPTSSAGPGLFTKPSASAGPGMFAAPATSAGPGLFAAPATSAGPGLFAAPATSAGPGLFAAPATSAGPGLFAAPATSAGTGLFAAPATSAGTGLFAAPATSAGTGLFAAPATSAGTGLFAAPPSSAGPGLFTKPSASAGPGMFAAPATSAGPGLFAAPATSAGTGLFAAPATSAGPGLFAAPATSAGPGLFAAPATSAGTGLFAAPATSAGTGLFAAPATSAGTGLFAAPATSAGTGLFAAPAASAGTGLFAAPPSSAGPGLFTKPSASAGPGLFHVDNKTSETTQIGTENKGPGPFSSKSDSQISGVASDITPAQDTGSFAAKPTQSDSSSGFSFKLPVESVGPKSTAFSFKSLSGNTAGQATETKANAPPFSFTASPGVFGASRKTTGEADDEEEDDEDVEDGSVVFSKRVTLLSCPADEHTVQLLGQGELEMVYGENTKPQIYAENDEGLILCDHTIEPHSTASIDKKSVTWTAEDENAVPPGDTRFTAKFSSQAAATEFISCFNDAVGIASQFSEHYEAEVEDLGPQEEDDEEEEPLFICTASLSVLKDGTQKERGEGQLKVVHDDDVPGCRVFMETSNSERMVNHIVCRQHNPLVMDSELSVMWTAKDFSTDEPVKQSFKVTFNSEDDRVAFVQTFEQARLMAVEAELDEL